jgi:hypothetical protein
MNTLGIHLNREFWGSLGAGAQAPKSKRRFCITIITIMGIPKQKG